MKALHILLLEDSDIDAELLSAHLAKAGVQFDIRRVVNRREFVAALEDAACDVILSDYSLPDFDGLSALNIARALRPEVPFIFVSGVVGEEFATNALKRGATDYVMKRNLARLATAVERAVAQAKERADLKQAEEALTRSQMSARLAAEAAGLGILNYTPKSGELECDEKAKELLGIATDGPLDLAAFLAGISEEDRPRLRGQLSRVTEWDPESTGGFADEFKIASQERWLAIRGEGRFEGGICSRILAVLRESTEEHLAREDLKQIASGLEQQVSDRTAELDRIWRLSPDLFAVCDFEGSLRRLNPAWRHLLDYDPDTLVGEPLETILHSDDCAFVSETIRQLSAGSSVARFETRIRKRDGSWRWIAWTAAPEGDAFYAVGRDITAEKTANTALAERNQELAEQIEQREQVEETLRQMQRLEAVGQLTSGVAHDFNNLLTVILGNIGFVERGIPKQDSKLTERLGYMRTAAERGAKLTEQLLAFSRRQQLRPKPLDLNVTVAGMRELLHSTIGGTVRIETVLKPDLWVALVDPTQIELIILNLAINARDAMEVGGAVSIETTNVTVSTRPKRPEEPQPGEYVVLSVSDTGSGMPPDVLAKAFEPFFTTKLVGKGSGLGLAQVYGFAKQSGGGVAIETELGEGTTVRVYLPRAEALPAPAEKEERSSRTGVTWNKTVLLVDDDSAVRNVTVALLSDLGYSVLEAGSGSAALDVLRGNRSLDVLLVDYAMPGMNGVELARAAAALRPELPILFITGYADWGALSELSAEMIIQKPFVDGELERKLDRVFRDQAQEKVVPFRTGSSLTR